MIYVKMVNIFWVFLLILVGAQNKGMNAAFQTLLTGVR